jgi:hypothetical protein
VSEVVRWRRVQLALLAVFALAPACGRDEPAAPAKLSVGDAEAELAEHAARAAQHDPGPAVAAEPSARPVPTRDGLTLGARLIDAGARPIAGGELAWIEVSEEGLPTVRASARSDATGAVWLVLPRAELPAQGALGLAASGAGTLRQLVVLERARWERAPLVNLDELTLPPGGALAGTVLDADGRPLAGALVGAGPELGELAGELAARARVWPLLTELGGANVPPIARTDAAGRYVLSGVPCGRVMVVALAAPPSGADGVPLLPDREQGLEVRAGEETSVRALVLGPSRPEERVEGTVRAPDGTPAGDVFVTLLVDGVPSPGGSARTSAEGRFVLLAPEGAPFALRAEDALGRWAPLQLDEVRGGDPARELRFGGSAAGVGR